MENIALKNRLSKIYELVKNGGTDGEKAAAKNALDKLLEKHNLQGIDLDSLDKSIYSFKYKTQLDEWLLLRLVYMFVEDQASYKSAIKDTWHKKEIELSLTYLDFITVSASYEYFKRHMLSQWKKICAAEVKRKRTSKSKNATRKALQQPFFSRYVIKSKLYKEGDLTSVNVSQMGKAEAENFKKMSAVEGGEYNRQMTNGLLIEN